MEHLHAVEIRLLYPTGGLGRPLGHHKELFLVSHCYVLFLVPQAGDVTNGVAGNNTRVTLTVVNVTDVTNQIAIAPPVELQDV